MLGHYTQEQIDFLKSICHLPRQKMADLFNEKFNQNRKAQAMKNWCTRNNIKRDYEKSPYVSQKHGFKKGVEPFNSYEQGFERVDSKGNVLIKHGKTLMRKSHYIWEQHNGAVPKDHYIVFKDDNKLNCFIDNLMLMNRSEHIRFNSDFKRMATPETKETCLLLAKLKTSRFKHDR